MKNDSLNSPRIINISWGKMEIETIGVGKDFKLFPGGGRAWDWRETNTQHEPGIQPDDVQELLDHGSTVVILSQGMERALKVSPETIALLKTKNIKFFVEETRKAVEHYNELVKKGEPVGGLFHSTC